MEKIVKKYGWGLLVLLAGLSYVFWRLTANRKVKGLAGNANVKAFLKAIRRGEGTAGENGYKTLFGGKLFNSFSSHPNICVPYGNTCSTAAGAYQMLYRTWAPMAVMLGLTDFSPESQDLAAIELIRQRGALDLVVSGRFEEAIQKCIKEWASLPVVIAFSDSKGYHAVGESYYSQSPVKLSILKEVFQKSGGIVV